MMNIRLAQDKDVAEIVAFNRAMALETEGKNRTYSRNLSVVFM
jgi:hypothetical protein